MTHRIEATETAVQGGGLDPAVRPVHVALVPCSGAAAMRLYERAVLDPPRGGELQVLLGPDVRGVATGGADRTVGVWPVGAGPRNGRALDRLVAGDLALFVASRRVIGAHTVLAVDAGLDAGRLSGASTQRGPGLVLCRGYALDLDFADLRELWGAGSPKGPTGIEVLEGPQVDDVFALITPTTHGQSNRAAPDSGEAGEVGASEVTELEPAPAASQAASSPQVVPPPVALPPQRDDMDRWFRQGLVAQRDALRAALKAAREGGHKHVDSLRRLAEALARRVEGRFPRLAETARMCAGLPEPAFLDHVPMLIRRVESEIGSTGDDPVTVLLVEDDATTVVMTQAILDAPGRRILVAGSKAEAERLLSLEAVDLIILDQTLPDADGRDLLVEMRERPATSAIPVIVVSGAEGPQPRTEGFALGADAYFHKPVHPSVLSSAVGAFLLRAAQIRDRALRDPLTGLRTRNVFLGSLTDAWSALLRQGEPLTLALFDVDRFRALNDFHGRDVGDAVLRRLGLLLSDTLRRSDLVARWADDAFAVGMPNTTLEAAHVAVDKIRSGLADEAWRAGDAVPSVSCAVALVALEAAPSVEEGVALAERRLAQAARGEGGRVVASDDPASVEGSTVLLVEDDPLTARLVKERLVRDGVNVTHVEDGLDALRVTPDMHTDAIILDVSTPGADGFGLLKKLRESASFASVPIMMLIQEREAQISRAFAMGATDTLKKPFSLTELSARVQRLITET